MLELQKKAELAKRFFEKELFNYYFKRYKSSIKKDKFYQTEEYYKPEFSEFEEIEWEDLSPEFQHCEQAVHWSKYGDGISCYIYKIPIQNFNTITYRMTTDGDDGWLVIFSHCGELLAAGNTLIEVIEWASDSFLESCLDCTDDLLSFQGSKMEERTFWGKPLEEVEAIGKQKFKN